MKMAKELHTIHKQGAKEVLGFLPIKYSWLLNNAGWTVQVNLLVDIFNWPSGFKLTLYKGQLQGGTPCMQRADYSYKLIFLLQKQF